MTKKMDEGGPRLSKGRAVSECISWPKQQLSCDQTSTLRWPKHSREGSRPRSQVPVTEVIP